MSSASVAEAPERNSTAAATACPKRSSGIATATASGTEGWSFKTSSTSSGNTFSPPVLMTTEPRPSRWMAPSASTVAKSPGTE